MMRIASFKTLGSQAGRCAALAVFVSVFFMAAAVSSAAAAANNAEAVVVEEKSVTSETVVGGEPGPETKQTKPFQSKKERLPAGAAVVGTDLDNQNKPLPDVVSYATSVVSRDANNLVLNTTISEAASDEVLSRLAGKIYAENNGPSYENVTIFWHVGTEPRKDKPWGRTDIAKGATDFVIVRLP